MIEVVEERTAYDKKGKPDEDGWFVKAIRLRGPDDPAPEPQREWSPSELRDGKWIGYRTVCYHSEPELWALHNVIPGLVERDTKRIGLRVGAFLRAWLPIVVAAVKGSPEGVREAVLALPKGFIP